MKNELHKSDDMKVDVNPNIKLFTKTENSIQHFFCNVTIKAGYGRCRSCECKGYISKHNGTHECKNCGHHYDRHRD